jgi:DNA-binding response OmpR family regulator
MKKTILLVEDEKAISKAYGEHFKKEGYLVEHAYDGVEGLKKAKTLKPDLILLDILLPELDGISVIKEVKADNSIAEIPILVLTNLSTGDKIMEAVRSGTTMYLVKSFHTLEDVSKKIKEIL